MKKTPLCQGILAENTPMNRRGDRINQVPAFLKDLSEGEAQAPLLKIEASLWHSEWLELIFPVHTKRLKHSFLYTSLAEIVENAHGLL